MGDRYDGSLDAEAGRCPRIRARDYERGISEWLRPAEEPWSWPRSWQNYTDSDHGPIRLGAVEDDPRRLTDREIDERAYAGLCWIREHMRDSRTEPVLNAVDSASAGTERLDDGTGVSGSTRGSNG